MKKISILTAVFICIFEYAGFTQFTDVTNELGLNVSSCGGAFGDYDNDGDLDIIVTGNTVHLFQNNNGFFTDTGVFDDLGSLEWSGAFWGDYNNDGYLDVYLTNDGPNFLYKNNGNGIFENVTDSAGVGEPNRGWSAAWADYDNDGDLDLYVAINTKDSFNAFYQNKGGEIFEKILDEKVIVHYEHFHHAACWCDYDNDGDTDLLVTRDGANDILYKNIIKESKFTKKTPFDSTRQSNGAAWGDYNNDGLIDLYIMDRDIGGYFNHLFKNNGDDDSFTDVTAEAGVQGLDDKSMGTGVTWGDFDNDGFLDLLLTNDENESANAENIYYRNKGNGTFENFTSYSGLKGNGNETVITGDYDNDGDLDIYFLNNNGNRFYKNNTSGNNWIKIKTVGTVSNSDGIGTMIRIIAGNLPQVRQITAGSGLASMNSLIAHFGLGQSTIVDSIFIEWPSNTTQVLYNQEVNKLITVFETGRTLTVTTTGTTNFGQNSATLHGTVIPNNDTITVFFEYGPTFFKYGTTTNYEYKTKATTWLICSAAEIPVAVQVMGLLPNTTYYYRIVAVNDTDTSYGEGSKFITYCSKYDIDTTFTFPTLSSASDYYSTDYRIIGLPGDSKLSVCDFLEGEQNKDWQVYWDNGKTSNFFKKFDGTSKFQFSLGRAFWIINKGPLSIIDTTIVSALLDDSGTVSIPLHEDWNLITNPFDKPIKWEDVQNANNNLKLPIWSYEDSIKNFTDETVFFNSCKGYYFDNTDTKLPSLKIPYSLTFSSPSSFAKRHSDPAAWRVRIVLSDGDLVDRATSFGVSSEAKKGLDCLDFRRPRAIAALPTVSFLRPEWDRNYSIFATDIRPEFEEMESWNFEVCGTQNKSSQLTLQGIEKIPKHFDVYLLDQRTGKYVDLRKRSTYNFVAIGDISKFRVVVGKPDVLQEQLKGISLPAKFSMSRSYPNPFNPSTTISVSIPVTSNVELKIYNMLGQEVKTIYSGTLETGQYHFIWDGKDETGKRSASGIYLYSLTSGTKVKLYGKTILMK